MGYQSRVRIRVVCILLMIGFCLGAMPVSAADLPDKPTAEHAKAVYLYNLDQGCVMFEKNAGDLMYPTSTVKLVTALLAIEALSDRLDETVTVTEEMLDEVRGNNISLMDGETVTIEDLLHALICGNANDAAVVLAYVVAGGTDAFVAQMNEYVKTLGTEKTVYENVTGLHTPNMVTTAYDTFLIAREASRNAKLLAISSESKYEMPKTNKSRERTIYNRNQLISRYTTTRYFNGYVQGLNAGSTAQGGYALATYAEHDRQSYICVVLGAEEVDNTIYSYQVANELLDWVYGSYGYVEVLTTDQIEQEVPVTLSEKVDYVTLRPANPITAFLPLDVVPETDLDYQYHVTVDSLTAPVEEGDVAGYVTVRYGDLVLGTADLVAMNKVERSEFLYSLQKLKDFTKNRVFIASVISLLVLALIYVFGTAFYRPRAGRRRRRRRYR